MATLEGPASQEVSRRIAASLLTGTELDGGGEARCISFAEYMEICLYDPAAGYYRTGEARVGKAGDFYTSSGIGDLMARAIARAAEQWYSAVQPIAGDDPLLLAEWGAGTGRLSAQLAAVWADKGTRTMPCFRQLLIEDHAGHAEAIQQSYRQLGIPTLPAVWTSLQAWERSEQWLGRGPTLLIANELLDAFPVHRITCRGGALRELGVAGHTSEGFRYVLLPVRDDRLLEAMKLGEMALAEGQTAEISLAANDWIMRLGGAMKSGRVLLIDYGDSGEELTAAHRMAGTLMTYRHHQASDSPFDQPGDRDITAHVNFTAIRRSAELAGFQTMYYGTQKQFLIDHGLLELLTDHDGADPFSDAARRNRAIRQLLISDGMSESFKVLILEKRGS